MVSSIPASSEREEIMIYPLVVIYNKTCAESDTCRALLAQTCGPLPIYIFDNSTREFGNREFCMEQGWVYLGGSGNQGLSKAYNQAIQALSGKTGHLCLLDDDTHLPDSFFADLQEAIQKAPEKPLYVPILQQNGRIISPNRADLPRRERYFASVEEALSAEPGDVRAFNSCMTIDLKVFGDYRYDERLFLDCVDHAFLRDMRERGIYPAVVPITCEHGFSGNQKGSLAGAKVRFAIFCRDTRVYYAYDRRQAECSLLRRALHLCWGYKTPVFFAILFSK